MELRYAAYNILFVVVNIATSYVLDGPGIRSKKEQNFPNPSIPALVRISSSYTIGTMFFAGIKLLWSGVEHLPLRPYSMLYVFTYCGK
jgi:hypothetical protein